MKSYNNVIGKIDSVYCGSAVDGKGLRVVVFANGCNLRCPFCHNPETLYGCGNEINAKDLVKRVLRYKNYIKNGGVTLSGGEPFLQPEFAEEVIDRLNSFGIKTVIETNGTIINESLIKKADYLIIDVKNQLTDEFSGYEKILSTLKKFNKTAVLTCVIVPTLNDTENKILILSHLKEKFPTVVKGIKLLPFRKLCEEKYKKMNIEFPFSNYLECNKETIENLKKYL